MVAAVGIAIKNALVWLVTSVAGKAFLALLVKLAFLGLFTIALGAMGYLPRSPLALAIHPLITMLAVIPYTRYIHAFVPVLPIVAVIQAWVTAVISFHLLKIYLRVGKVIKG